MTHRTLTCPDHGWTGPAISQAEADRRGIEHGCPVHNADLASRPDPAGMTRTERADELRALMEADLWAGWNLTRSRIDALVGRATFTHELADADLLCHEILTGTRPSLEGILAKFPADKPVIVVEAP